MAERHYDYWLPTEDEFIKFRVELNKMIYFYQDKFNETGNHTYFKVQADLQKLALKICSPED